MSFELLPGTKAPVKVWADLNEVEHAAQQQLRNVGNLPWTHGVAVMPDVHYGKGATVGSVIAMENAVAPAAVGVDIGCGMAAVRSSLTANDLPDDLGRIRSAIEAAVPVGFNSYDEPVTGLPPGFMDLHEGVQHLAGKAAKQVGTLGGGNHFIELCLDENDHVWLMLHSGSRNIGKELAERHIKVAQAMEHNKGLVDKDLAVFLAETPEMQAYRRDLYWAQNYALKNRETMLVRSMVAVRDRVEPLRVMSSFWDIQSLVQCHHNYVSEESFDGVELLVTRKGAISTAEGRLGIIPGSMGTGSYIVRGKANPESFNSASHGAGRKMSRNKAKQQFSIEDLQAQTDGVECRKDQGVLDEIPGAYKNLETVMSQQTDLVDVVHRLRTIVCVKG